MIVIKITFNTSCLNDFLNISYHFLSYSFNQNPEYLASSKKVVSIFFPASQYLFKHNFFIFQNYKILNLEAQIFNICIDLYANR